eukprot:CAMPEP_0194357720 /NCGR_PEP_ID=MMETSP0174-20130528/5170_1 /TAXON_ID=216777 /ORGANISM="Proboscia alata, Strain PI-D3" /LENGTH=121 /DNA_ID=CAMNT_0039127859 /DNA_START=50 /DNA_END=411 /DNA_ORIENTATION=+
MSKQTSNSTRKAAKHAGRHFVQHNYHDYAEVKNVNELEAMLNAPNSSEILYRSRSDSKDLSSDNTDNDSVSSLSGVRNISQDPLDIEKKRPRNRGGVAVSFPLKLHQMLDDVDKDGMSHIV